jgi:hypothetical protein
MSTPKIQALGITQEGSPTNWKASGYVIEAMEALQVLASQQGAQRQREA